MERHSQSESIKSQFAMVHGSAGEAPRVMGILKAFWPLLVISTLLGYLIREALPFSFLSLSQVGIAFIFLSIIGAVLLTIGDKKLSNYLKGAKGEESVLRELTFLSSDYTIFNGIRLDNGRYNFDHIVVGPSGVFIIETKNWNGHVQFLDGEVQIDGKKINFSPINQVKGEASELSNFFDTHNIPLFSIKTVLCFVDSKLDESISNVNGVIVCNKSSLRNVLTLELNDEIEINIQNKTNNLLLSLLD